ncbi:hypothetical protein [Lentibacillus sp. JNUCC-1]|uniref:hypothetical protein n=1 Tax=Lentibacillus sp. JNUCC-1 TaxID=2654513 RepID=UPI002F91495C
MEKVKHSPDMEKIMKLPISYEEKGKEMGKKEVAASMLEEGFTLEVIAKVTGLSHAAIKTLNH